MKFKKLRKWSKTEEELLLKHFHDIPFSTHNGSRFEYLYLKLKENGFNVDGLTPKAISRKTYRLGLRSITITNEPLIEMKCKYCGKELMQKQRYKVVVCELCRKKQKHKKTERYMAYQKQYQKKWKKKQKAKVGLNTLKE